MHKNLFIVLLFVGITTNAQQNYLESNYEIGAFNSGFSLQQLYDGSGFLTENYKKSLLSNLSDENCIFFDQSYSLKYARGRWEFAIGNHITASLIYPKDLVKLTLNGNTPYIGENLSFADLNLEAIHYSKFEVEYQFKEKAFVSLSYLAGHQFATLDVEKADFYTSDLGESISYDLEMEAHYSDTNQLLDNLLAINGNGMSVGIKYQTKINDMKFDMAVSDVGFIVWNDKSSKVTISESYEFNGIEINDLSDINDSIIDSELEELKIDVEDATQTRYTYALPFRFQALLTRDLITDLTDEISIGIDYRNRLYPKPRLHIDLHKRIKKHEFVLGYHVYGVEHPGLQFAYKFYGSKTEYKLYTKHINYIDANYVYGVHVGVVMKRLF